MNHLSGALGLVVVSRNEAGGEVEAERLSRFAVFLVPLGSFDITRTGLSAAVRTRWTMSQTLVDKLLESFDELDRCIAHTRTVLEHKRGVPEDILQRVSQYTDIVAKQRNLASDLRSFLAEQNWEEVARHVRLINGLSSMIRDDAQAILTGTAPEQNTPKDHTLV